MLKGIVIIGGPAKGTRFRPLSFDVPKPLFPIAGVPIVQHHIEALVRVPGLKEILLIGFYQYTDDLEEFVLSMQKEFRVTVRYLQEYAPLGTAGSLYHFRDQILAGRPEHLLVLNGDVCGDFDFSEILAYHAQLSDAPHFTLACTEATRSQSVNFGCVVEDRQTHEVLHYVEKPSTFVSTLINCGVYVLHPSIFDYIRNVYESRLEERYGDSDVLRPTLASAAIRVDEAIHFETEIFGSLLAESGKLFTYIHTRFWSQIKSAGAAIYANRHCLKIYQRTHPERLLAPARSRAASSRSTEPLPIAVADTPVPPTVIPDVSIHPTAIVDPTAVLGPNVSIGAGCTVGRGVRVRDSIVLPGATLHDHACVLYTVVGWNARVGDWTRLEGSAPGPNPNAPFAKLDVPDTFNEKGQLNPTVCVIGAHCTVEAELLVRNCIVLPNKHITRSCQNQIIL